MPLRKIKDFPKVCKHPEHNPPTMIVLEVGVYEYTCPSCGKVTIFTVPEYQNGSGLSYDSRDIPFRNRPKPMLFAYEKYPMYCGDGREFKSEIY